MLSQLPQAKMTRRDFVVGSAALGVALGSLPLLGACVQRPSEIIDEPKSGAVKADKTGGILYLSSYIPSSFDPFYLEENAGIQIASCLFDPLVKYDYQSGELVGAAAKSWDITEGGTVFTFHLVEDARFHNDKTVTAKDFKYGWERILKPDAKGETSSNAPYIMPIQGADALVAGEAEDISGIKVIDDATLEVTLAYPFYEFIQMLAYPAFAPVPFMGATGGFTSIDEAPIGNGAFKMDPNDSWQNDSFYGSQYGALKLVRFDDYGKEPALLRAVEFCFFASDMEPTAGDSGEDFVWTALNGPMDKGAVPSHLMNAAASMRAAPFSAAASAQAAPAASAQAAPAPAVLRPVANGELLSYDEKTYESFRLGELDLASIPLKELKEARLVYGESTDGYTAGPDNQTLTGMEVCTEFLWVSFESGIFVDANIRKAISYAINREALCEELFFGNCTPATGIIPPGIEGFRDGAWPAATYDVDKARQALSDAGYPDGKELGPVTLIIWDFENERNFFKMIEDDLKAVGFTVKTSLIRTQDELWDTLLGSGGLASNGWIADWPSMESFLTPLFTSFGNYNQLNYHNEEVDEKIKAARTTEDAKERISALQAVEDIIAADMPVIPLLYTHHALACSRRVNDLYVAPDGMINLTKAWVSS
ncbi:MAG: ABC transporter substrate-binding protein [Coriobacteriales bacterium]|jgi:ABC-type transport system substrate-binding protein|nr:ABC transporter substrate-binding protein [Coriobacteriales bacterium]